MRTDSNVRSLFQEIPRIQGEQLTLHQITQDDAEEFDRLRHDARVNKMLPTFLFEQKHDDIHEVIDKLYVEGMEGSLFLGIYHEDKFCGVAEFYGYREEAHKISIGGRMLPEYWGCGFATELIGLMCRYLEENTTIEIITASSMIQNQGSYKSLSRNGFTLVVHDALEDWGFDEPVAVDKWIR